MEELYAQLTKELLRVNQSLSPEKARTWVEILWEDFETTRARAGRKYRGQEMTERIVRQWIKQYGPRLHEFLAQNPKYKHLLEDDKLIH